jgi:hypothetical protein
VPSYLVEKFSARVAGDRQARERQELRANRRHHRALAAVRPNRIGRFKSHGSRVVEPRRGRSATAFVAIFFGLVTVAAGTAAPETKFVSTRYGYSIILPGNSNRWQASYAHVTWSSGRLGPGSPGFDTFTDLQTERAYFIASRRPPTGSTLQKCTAFVISSHPPACLAPHASLAKSMLSGAPARLLTLSCTDGYFVIGITALHAQRGYFMFVASPTSISRASDRRAFDAARRSFRFLGK